VLAGASGPAPAPTQAVPGGAGHVPVVGQTGGVPTVSGVSAAASATAAAAPAPTTTTPQSSVAGQLAASLRTLAGRADGVHVMTVRLHPDELGPVRLVARLTGNDVHLSVTTSTVAAAEAVTAAGPRLHDALAASGLTASGLNVDHDAALAGQGAAGQQLGQGTPNGSPDAGAGGRSGSAHQGRGADGSSGGRHRLDVGPAESASRHPSARTLDLHV
jgi:flagellar hook-length control protein FliK